MAPETEERFSPTLLLALVNTLAPATSALLAEALGKVFSVERVLKELHTLETLGLLTLGDGDNWFPTWKGVTVLSRPGTRKARDISRMRFLWKAASKGK